MSRPASRPALLLLVAVALLLRLAPLDHGMPRPYVPDSHVVRNSLAPVVTVTVEGSVPVAR